MTTLGKQKWNVPLRLSIVTYNPGIWYTGNIVIGGQKLIFEFESKEDVRTLNLEGKDMHDIKRLVCITIKTGETRIVVLDDIEYLIFFRIILLAIAGNMESRRNTGFDMECTFALDRAEVKHIRTRKKFKIAIPQ